MYLHAVEAGGPERQAAAAAHHSGQRAEDDGDGSLHLCLSLGHRTAFSFEVQTTSRHFLLVCFSGFAHICVSSEHTMMTKTPADLPFASLKHHSARTGEESVVPTSPSPGCAEESGPDFALEAPRWLVGILKTSKQLRIY